MIASDNLLNFLIKITNGKFKHTKLKERIIADYMCFYLKSDDPKFKIFDRKIIQLVESGLTDKIRSDHYDGRLVEDESGPTVLTLDQLGVGFQIWLLFLLISSVCFISEFVVKFVSSLYQKLITVGNRCHEL